jgi:hypothetical protein
MGGDSGRTFGSDGKETASGALLVQADNADPEVVTDRRRM